MPPSGPEKPALQVHAASTELASGELELIGHAMHVDATVAATAVEYVAAAQSVHRAVPVMILYFPAAHAVHVPAGPVYPRLQLQPIVVEQPAHVLPEPVGHARHVAAVVAATVVEYVPTPQEVQATVPVVVLYFPAVQAVHTPPFGPV